VEAVLWVQVRRYSAVQQIDAASSQLPSKNNQRETIGDEAFI
jgi:hypothetical protein